MKKARGTLRSLAAAALAIAGAGCFDGSVNVTINVDDASAVDRYRLVVYEAPNKPDDEGLFNCRDLSFDDIPADVLDEALVLDVEAGPGESIDLRDIPREPEKLFFVEAFNDTGASIIAGCADVGEISEPTPVVIDTEMRKTSQLTTGLLDAGGGLGIVEVFVVGIDGNPAVSDIRARLRGAGAGTALYETTVEVQTNGAGEISLDLNMAPDVGNLDAGPIELEVRVAWEQSPSPPVSALLMNDPLLADVVGDTAVRSSARGGNDLLEVARIGQMGSLGIVVLATDPPAGGRAFTNLHRFRFDGSALQKIGTVPVGFDEAAGNSSARTLGVIRTEGTDKIVTVWSDPGQPVGSELRWTELLAGGVNEKTAPYSAIPNKLAPFNDCIIPRDSALIGQSLSNRTELEFAAISGEMLVREDAILPSSFGASELIALGCVRDTSNQLRTTLVIDREAVGGDISNFAPVFAAFIPDPDTGTDDIYVGEASAAAGSATATTAHIGSIGTAGDGSIVLGEVTSSGPATSRYLLQPVHAANAVAVEFQSSDPTPSVVVQTAEGDINGDGVTDTVSILAVGVTVDGINAQVHISMGVPGSPKRLRAQLPSAIELIGARLRLVDIDGDGTDDIVVSSADFLRVYLMGAR